jgi:hypothetical protein
MSKAQYKVGQAVCREAGLFDGTPAEQFIVLRVLLEDRWGQPAYQVYGRSDGLGRVMTELELHPFSQSRHS